MRVAVSTAAGAEPEPLPLASNKHTAATDARREELQGVAGPSADMQAVLTVAGVEPEFLPQASNHHPAPTGAQPEEQHVMAAPRADVPLCCFFVVGDVGQPGAPRVAVARAMRAMLNEVHASFVLLTGDNFYDCESSADFDVNFELLQREMLDSVPLPWYAVQGNHDVKHGGAEMHTDTFHGSLNIDRGWVFRCPNSFYRLGEDWHCLREELQEPTLAPWPESLLDVVVINTNKKMSVPNFIGIKEGQLKATHVSWNDQKIWLRDALAHSPAQWKLVVGHHPIEFVPQGFVEHGLPGVRFLTAGFMKGHATSKMRGTGMRDVVVAGQADMYLCGHQHLMAHLKRAPKQPGRSLAGALATGKPAAWTGSPGAGDGSVDYMIVGSSSKLEQDFEDFETEPTVELGRWQAEQVAKKQQKMSEMWFAQHIGFALVVATPDSLTTRFYRVHGDGVEGQTGAQARECGDISQPAGPHVTLLHEVVRQAS